MTREAFDEVARRQDEYIASNDMVQIDGWIGNDPTLRTRARLLMEKRYANIAGMQQKLYFARDDDTEPEVRVIYTPGLRRPATPTIASSPSTSTTTSPASSTPTTSVSRRRAACGCGTTSSSRRAASRCTRASR